MRLFPVRWMLDALCWCLGHGDIDRGCVRLGFALARLLDRLGNPEQAEKLRRDAELLLDLHISSACYQLAAQSRDVQEKFLQDLYRR